MNEIIEALKAERNKIDAAIEALGGDVVKGKRKYTKKAGKHGGKRHLSAAARKAISVAAKKRWKEAKANGKNSL